MSLRNAPTPYYFTQKASRCLRSSGTFSRIKINMIESKMLARHYLKYSIKKHNCMQIVIITYQYPLNHSKLSIMLHVVCAVTLQPSFKAFNVAFK